MTPRVSVVIPTFNHAATLPRAISSVLNQTYTDFELIIVDDGSTDDTKKVIASYIDPRIRSITHEKNSGVAAARTTGIKAALADYIAFQDSDDEWSPTKLEKQVKLLQNAPATIGLVYCTFEREYKNGSLEHIPNKSVKKTSGNLHSDLLYKNWITLQAVLVRKSCFDAIGFFDPTMHILDDWEWILRLAKKYEIAFIPETLAKTYYTAGNLTQQKKIRMNDRKIILQKHFDDYKKSPKALARLANMIAGAELMQGNTKESRKYFAEALHVRPLGFSSYIGYLKTFLIFR